MSPLRTAAGGNQSEQTPLRPRLWKTELAQLAAETGLQITVCHLPPGTSKWNKIEHRLFSHISMNWRGRPVTSHHVIVQSIAATTPAGIKIPDAQLAALHNSGALHRHDWHPELNYTLNPPRN